MRNKKRKVGRPKGVKSKGSIKLISILSEYSVDFTEESIQTAKDEINQRAELERGRIRKMNELILEIYNELPEKIKHKLSLLIMLNEIRCDEAYHKGRTDLYLGIANMKEHILKYIFLNMINKDKVEKAESDIKHIFEAALVNYLLINAMKGNSQKELVNRYGKNEAFWTRVKETDAMGNTRRFRKWLQQIINHREDSNEGSYEKDLPINGKEFFHVTGEREEMEDRLNERAQEWKIAEKIADKDLEKAVEFLKSGGHSEATIRKFKKIKCRK